ncbi:hypothetical protein [Okeania sp. SIO2B3]|nr:hypothetical protein [Okeania sp. SIO2B3]
MSTILIYICIAEERRKKEEGRRRNLALSEFYNGFHFDGPQ